MNGSRNMLECFHVQELVRFVGKKFAYIKQLYGLCTVLPIAS
jgi:hypothetical protein